MDISQRGYRTQEPFASRPETSVVWKKVFDELRKDSLGVHGLAAKLLIPPDELVKLVFGLVVIGMPSGNRPMGTRGKPELRLVEN